MGVDGSVLLDTVLNLAHYHHEHEKFYAQAPLEDALRLHRHSRALKALADRWSVTSPEDHAVMSPYAGAEDLNDPAALQLDGVLFMEGEGEPAELTRIIRELRGGADDSRATGDWLAEAMESTWSVAHQLLMDYPALSDVMGERHRIIANDWQAAAMSQLVGRLLERAAVILESVDFTPAGLRLDLSGDRAAPGYLYSAAELIDRAADLLAESAGLVHDNERRWRYFRSRVAKLTL